MFNRGYLTLYFLFSSFYFFAQDLHHQMISSQGSNTTTSSGLIVKQTIGQQSISGASNGDLVVQQGFQQSFWETRIIESNTLEIIITTYPNPFRDIINFQFSEFSETSIKVTMFDINGRLVYSKSNAVVDNLLSINLAGLPSAQYLVMLSNKNINYFTKILKND